MSRMAVMVLLTSFAFLNGCAALSPYSSLTKVDLSLEGSPTLNPDLNDRPSPVVIHLIELKHPVAFKNADFFSLYQRPKETLSPDFVMLEELELRPGESLDLKLSVQNDTRYVGVLAAYRDLSEAEWRYVIPLKNRKRHDVRLYLDADGIRKQNADSRNRD
ncbi:MAG TPA: type VI secretion system lipoprotein TssJ [Pseudomonas xinjiangensis]|uniref:Type VI secretion system lipoprotein TssJ n=2 Tax=root TaxID=1 RepID=A0A7V1BRF1_9GAMM|nr:type VI secretion system lipoprotein TssJ [Halopseudomonas xinjiangensis]HEC47826.1 type VI secretion system lipoprotein TssJ [Halopseudomonas xinjiangensis]